jgi:hypothetical protein
MCPPRSGERWFRRFANPPGIAQGCERKF